MRARVAVGALAVAVLAIGCTSDAVPGAGGPGVPDEAVGSWTLVAASVDGRELAIPDGITMEVVREGEGWSVGGVSACNSYFTSFVVEDDRLVASPVGSTMMACMPESIMELESLHLAALQRVTAMRLDTERLEATGEGVVLSFERTA